MDKSAHLELQKLMETCTNDGLRNAAMMVRLAPRTMTFEELAAAIEDVANQPLSEELLGVP